MRVFQCMQPLIEVFCCPVGIQGNGQVDEGRPLETHGVGLPGAEETQFAKLGAQFGKCRLEVGDRLQVGTQAQPRGSCAGGRALAFDLHADGLEPRTAPGLARRRRTC